VGNLTAPRPVQHVHPVGGLCCVDTMCNAQVAQMPQVRVSICNAHSHGTPDTPGVTNLPYCAHTVHRKPLPACLVSHAALKQSHQHSTSHLVNESLSQRVT
jgi:hypothetical protein